MIFVTGGTGILGSYLLLELVKRNEKIVAVKRKTSNTEKVFSLFKRFNQEKLYENIDWIEGDLSDYEFLQSVLNRTEIIYHCAAMVSYDERQRNALFETNVEITKILLNVALEANVKAFCHVSSIAVFDEKNDEKIITEKSEWNKELNHSSYAESKFLSEMEVWRAYQEGLNAIIVNPGIILGSTDFSQSSGTLFNIHHSAFSFATSGNAAFVDAQDVAYCMVELNEKKCFGERFIVISESKSYQEIANTLRKLYHKKPSFFISDIGLKIAVVFAKLLKFFIPKLNELNWATYEALTSKSTLSNAKVKEKLNFEFISVEKSLKENAKYFLATNKT